MGGKETVFILLMAALVSLGHSLDWIGAGNWTQDNLTTIWAKINSLDATAQENITAFVQKISDQLNTEWHPAWNVVILRRHQGANFDTVLYGYGFRDHWFWANGLKTLAGEYFSIIIWKDYNCIKWYTYDPTAPISKTYSDSIMWGLDSKLRNTVAQRSLSEIWKAAQAIQEIVPGANKDLYQEKHAYSIIASQAATNIYFHFKVCVKDFMVIGGIGLTPQGYSGGYGLLLQMRDS